MTTHDVEILNRVTRELSSLGADGWKIRLDHTDQGTQFVFLDPEETQKHTIVSLLQYIDVQIPPPFLKVLERACAHGQDREKHPLEYDVRKAILGAGMSQVAQ